jgi:hypothetical protein
MHESNLESTTISSSARDVLEFPPTHSREETGRASLAMAIEARCMAGAAAGSP